MTHWPIPKWVCLFYGVLTSDVCASQQGEKLESSSVSHLPCGESAQWRIVVVYWNYWIRMAGVWVFWDSFEIILSIYWLVCYFKMVQIAWSVDQRLIWTHLCSFVPAGFHPRGSIGAQFSAISGGHSLPVYPPLSTSSRSLTWSFRDIFGWTNWGINKAIPIGKEWSTISTIWFWVYTYKGTFFMTKPLWWSSFWNWYELSSGSVHEPWYQLGIWW